MVDQQRRSYAVLRSSQTGLSSSCTMQTVAYRQDTHHFTFTILTSSEVRALNSYDATTPVRNTILSNHNAVGKLMLV